MGEEKITITPRIKRVLPFIIGVFIVLFSYSFEFFSPFSKEYYALEKEFLALKKENTIVLREVKKLSEGTKIHDEYLKINKKKNIAYNKLSKEKEHQKFLGFRSFQLFVGEFGPWFAIFIYSLFMLFRSFYLERKNIGIKVLHGLMIFTSLFYLGWVFQVNQDYSKITYYVMAIFSAFMVVLAVAWITKYREHNQKKLKRYIHAISKVALLNSKPEKREEVLEVVKKITKGEAV